LGVNVPWPALDDPPPAAGVAGLGDAAVATAAAGVAAFAAVTPNSVAPMTPPPSMAADMAAAVTATRIRVIQAMLGGRTSGSIRERWEIAQRQPMTTAMSSNVA
jgi:hypothetical protein